MNVSTQVLTVGAASFASVAALLLVPAISRRIQFQTRWFLAGFAVFCAYCLAVGSNVPVWPVETLFNPSYYNWGGKYLGVAVWLVTLLLIARTVPNFKASHAGFTVRHAPGSVLPGVYCSLFLVVFNAVISYTTGTANYNEETLWFQATMPGLDEEPMFRGILLFLLVRALNSHRVSCFGAQLDYSGIGLCLIFGALHAAFAFAHGAYIVLLILGVTTTYSMAFLWLRERTGSLVFPVVVHNLLNLSGQIIRPHA